MVLGAIAPGAVAQSTVPAPMNQPRFLHTATLLPDGKVLVVGGIDSAAITSAELYDPATNHWGNAASLSPARFVHTATLLSNGKVLVLGGSIGDTLLADAAVYDSATDTWGSAASLPMPRYLHTATLLPNGTVLVVGGTHTNPNEAISSAELYDSATGTWSSAASLTTRRSRHTATLLPNGKVLVVGGDFDGGVLASGEIYDPASNTWSSAASLTTARQRHAATLLPNGKVLVVGGIDQGGQFGAAGNVLASAELYDPATNSWSSAAGLTAARQRPTATLLPNGVVLVAGGASGGNLGSILASVEIYTSNVPPVQVVEYFNASLDHYFITWVAGEIALLDAGTTIKGWLRTGYTFKANTIAQTTTTPICRYYLPPVFGDSHFFGRGTVECNATGRNNPGFILEDPAFMQMFLPLAGTCPALTTPIYRVFSNRGDANHRYMTDRVVRDQMVARGWLAEGDGPDRVVMCAPE